MMWLITIFICIYRVDDHAPHQIRQDRHPPRKTDASPRSCGVGVGGSLDKRDGIHFLRVRLFFGSAGSRLSSRDIRWTASARLVGWILLSYSIYSWRQPAAAYRRRLRLRLSFTNLKNDCTHQRLMQCPCRRIPIPYGMQPMWSGICLSRQWCHKPARGRGI
jgi:hypothetical protein